VNGMTELFPKLGVHCFECRGEDGESGWRERIKTLLTHGDGCGTGEFRQSGNLWNNACQNSQTQMALMGIDSYLHPGISGDAAIDTIQQDSGRSVSDLAHLSLYRSRAHGMLQVSKMRQQLSYA
jgi:hypothetical protein